MAQAKSTLLGRNGQEKRQPFAASWIHAGATGKVCLMMISKASLRRIARRHWLVPQGRRVSDLTVRENLSIV
jgi:ABC-type branched-subunit amino acid transport system ATPase component